MPKKNKSAIPEEMANIKEELTINPSAQGPNKFFEQQCANPTYEEEHIKRAIQEVSEQGFSG